MPDRTSLLFALPGFRVLDVTAEPDGGRRVLVETISKEGGCPSCGVVSASIKERPVSRVKDLPHGPTAVRVWVRKRRFTCAERLCPRRSFTETSDQLPARARLTMRLRVKISESVTRTNTGDDRRRDGLRRGVGDGASDPGRRGGRRGRAGGSDIDDRHR